MNRIDESNSVDLITKDYSVSNDLLVELINDNDCNYRVRIELSNHSFVKSIKLLGNSFS